MPSEVKTLPISSIRTDGGTQTRVALNVPAVREYSEAMTDGAHLPPVTVFFDGADYWLADGFHRMQASMDIGVLSTEAEIHAGGQRAARLYSTGANGSHGVQRTNDDKRLAVTTLLQDAEWGDWSDREIARQCKVVHSFVASVRRSLDSESSEDTHSRSFKTKHGTTATMKTNGVANRSSTLASRNRAFARFDGIEINKLDA